MQCPNCSAENRDAAKFCVRCGRGLGLACPSCGTPHQADDLFCAECGHALQAGAVAAPEAASEAREAPTAERRFVSVLFADLVGFTSASESRDAEETRELLTRYFDTCRRLVTLYGGTVEKFIGDAVMAVWGTPTAREDDAERAVRAALDIVAAVSALGDEIGAPQLRARAGVLAGEAAVTLGAEGEGMVAGDLVNTASRIQAAAEPGTVLVGEATRRATQASIDYVDAGAHELKGKAEPVPLFRAVRVTAGRGGARKAEALEPPFAGRDRELRLLKELLHASAEEGKAHLVSVVAIPGIGKSRLAWELFKYVDGLATVNVWWWRGRCLAYGEGVTYWALAEMVRTRADIVEGEHPDSARPKLHEAIAPYIADPDELEWIEPRLAHLLGLEERAAADREDLFAAWRLYFERLSEYQPVVLVFEDMHWADTSLLEFVEYLLEWSRNHPIFVLTLARPDLQERHPMWGAGKRNFSALFLEPLSAKAIEELLDGFVPGLPAGLRGQILERAEGVPLYAVETVRMLLDRGLLEREGGRYRPTGPIDALEIPETLHALVAARLDGLDAEERGLIQDAAVLGKSFTKEALAVLNGSSREALEPRLTSLVRKEVLSLQADPRSPERGQYAFLQDLLRQVAYETLARRERKKRHLAAAAYLEEGWGPAEQEIAEVVAAHYVAAIESAPEDDDAAEIGAKARAMLTRAGERAASLAASEEAMRYFERAADLAADPREEAALRERAGETAWTGGDSATALDELGRALALFESVGETHPAARVAARLGEVEWQTGELEQALARMEAAYTVLSDEEPDADVAWLAAQLGRLHYFRGDLELAEERVESALSLAERLWLPEVLSQTLNTSGMIASWKGRSETALGLIRHALEVALEHDRPTPALRAYLNLGDTLCRRDRYEEALVHYDDGVALARRVGNRTWERFLLLESAYPLVQIGRWKDADTRLTEFTLPEVGGTQVLSYLFALAELETARGRVADAEAALTFGAQFAKSADVQERAGYAGCQAIVLLAAKRFEEALAAAEQALEAVAVLSWASQPAKQGLVAGVEAALALGDLDRAEDLIARIDVEPQGAAPMYLRAHAARFRAKLFSVLGQDGKVEPRLKSAAATFRELGLPFWTAVAELELGEWLASHSRESEAAPLRSRAREVFERLEATPWLERAELAGAVDEADVVAAGSETTSAAG
jgi:class 3 adenylate cyclase/tetratricopeptide (TPR) repeat protein